MKHAREWLEDGDKVKATIWFRGREMTHRELGARILEKLEKILWTSAKSRPGHGWKGTRCSLFLGPKRHKGAKVEHSAPSPSQTALPKPAPQAPAVAPVQASQPEAAAAKPET
jgi:translation initiation factor IF-3